MAGFPAAILLASINTGELIIHTRAGALTVNAPVVTSGATARFLTKIGNGSLILGGTNVYTGTTRVASGKLFVNGSLSNLNANLTVDPGATLGGSGTLGRNVTIADGGKLEFNLGAPAGTHVPLTRSASRTLAFSGSSVLTITSSGGAGPVDHFALSSIASPQTVGTAITDITITAQDAANQTATSFTGTVTFGGTAGITGTSASFINGVFTNVIVTPTAAGSNRTLTVNDGAGHTGSASFTIQSVFAKWSGGPFVNNLTNSSPILDFDGGSLPTGIEWVVGGDPTNAADDTGLAPTIDLTTDPNGKLLFTYRRTTNAKNDANTTIAVQYGANLAGWTTAAHQGTGANQITITQTPNGPGLEIVTVALPAGLAGGGKLFVRLHVAIATE